MKKRRILPRFGLRSILVLTTLVAVICGGWLRQIQIQRDVCNRLSQVGIEVELDEPALWLRWLPKSMLSLGGGHYFCPVTEVDLDAGFDSVLREKPNDNDLLVWVSRLSTLKRLEFDRLLVDSSDFSLLAGSGLEELDLSCGDLTDEDISRLPRLPKLKLLDLSLNDGLTGKHINFQRFPSLQQFYCSHSKINDDAMLEIGRLRNLQALVLVQTNLTDTGVALLSSLEKLELLDLASTKTTGAGIGAIRGLKSVDLSNTDLVDEALVEISRLPKLTSLMFSDCVFVTDKGLCALAHHACLENVAASHCGITDASVEALASIKSLEHLRLDDTYVRSLGKLAACKNLRLLSLSSSEVPVEDAMLFSKHKECRILIDDPSNETEQLSLGSYCGCFCDGTVYLTNAELSSMSGERIGGNGNEVVLNGLVGLSAKHFDNFSCDVTELSLARSKVHSDVFECLNDYPLLESLDATMCPLTESDLQAIGKLTRLTSLELGATEIDDGGMLAIKSLSNLNKLSLGKTKITSASLNIIGQFKQLCSLKLPFVPDAASLLELLEACPSLTSIEVVEAGSEFNLDILSREALRLHDIEPTTKQLKRMLELQWQRANENSIVAGQKLTDQHCAVLANFKNISELDLSNSSVTDAGIAHLAQMPELDTLNISNTNVSAVGLRSLHEKYFSTLACAPKSWSIEFVEALLEFSNLSELSLPFSEMPRDMALAFASSATEKIKLGWFEGGPKYQNRFYISDEDVAWMAGMLPFNGSAAQHFLVGSLIDDAKMAEFVTSPSIESVCVKNATCTADVLIAKLLSCRNLKRFSMSDVRLLPSDICRLAALEHLEELELANCDLTWDHFAALSRLQNLSTLSISGDFTKLDGLLEITKLPRLRKLNLATTSSTEKYEEMQRELGKRCEIVRLPR